MGKKSKDKGYRGENELRKKLEDRGIPTKRVPLSGASDFQKGDLILDIKDKKILGEVKWRKNGFKQIYKWIEEADVLFIKRDYSDYLVVQRLKDYCKGINNEK